MRIIGGGHAYSILTVSKLLLGIKFDLAWFDSVQNLIIDYWGVYGRVGDLLLVSSKLPWWIVVGVRLDLVRWNVLKVWRLFYYIRTL
jgi:hypothetical protein